MIFKELFEKIKDFFTNNKKLAIIVCLGVIIVLLLIILLISIVSSSGKKNSFTDTEIILTETQMIPNGPELQNDYVISRQTKEKWSDEEVNDWFTIPTLKDVENLGKSNDSLIIDLLGNAP